MKIISGWNTFDETTSISQQTDRLTKKKTTAGDLPKSLYQDHIGKFMQVDKSLQYRYVKIIPVMKHKVIFCQ